MVLVIPLRAGYFLRFGDLDPVMSVDLNSQALCPVMTEDFFDDYLSFCGMLEIEFVFGSELPTGYFEDMEIAGEKERFGIIPI